MIRFECDYLEGAHPRILEALAKTNLEQTPGYGEDVYCDRARAMIRALCQREDADVHFLVGGTQTNATVISAALRTHQGVISASSGHINVHETGAIETGGHKVLAVPSANGKITAEDVRRVYQAHWGDSTHEHMVQPSMVYLSFPTETGILYSLKELTAISDVCRETGLLLYVDGARLGYGLQSRQNDITLPDLARLCDAFYIGGTKQGMLFGEAVVLLHPLLKKDFRYIIKQHGGMFAKGRMLGLQYCVMLEEGLYFQAAKHADELAIRLREAILAKGYPLLYDSYTNQQYPILPNEKMDALQERYSFSFWAKTDENHSAVRFCTSWATKSEDVEQLIRDL